MNEPYYIDYSIMSTLMTCEEKARLSYHEHLRPVVTAPPLTFGAAFHSGVEEWYRSASTDRARAAFLAEVRERGSALPLTIESDEKRSIERGIYLLEAYLEKYKTEPYEILRRPDDGTPYVEVGFAIYIMEWRGHPVMYTGKIDRLMTSKLDGKPRNFELKTTGQGLGRFLDHCRPNHQVTGYHIAAQALGIEVTATIWDAVFVSQRQPNPKKGGWATYGIDPEADFARRETRRSATDCEEWLFDVRTAATRWLTLRESGLTRWMRNAPTACFMFGGCQYEELCSTNGNENVRKSNFRVEVWEPWKGIAATS